MEYIKNKFFILNDNFEILTFLRKGKENSKIFIPKRENSDEEFEFYLKLFETLDDVTVESATYLDTRSTMSIDYKFKCVNGKLKGEREVYVRNYYFAFANFTPEIVGRINELCNEFGFYPYFLGIEELENISSDDLLKHEESLLMDPNFTNEVRELKKELR